MTKSWTDERLEERFDAIDRRFDAVDGRLDRMDGWLDRMDADIRELRRETNARFDKMSADVKAGFDRMDERFAKVDERFEAMHRLLIQGGVVIIAALLGLIGTQL